MSAVPAVQLEGVHKSFGKLEVLRGIDLALAEHEVVCLIGASGSGKSTLLRCVNVLEPIDAGRILVSGETVTAPGVDVNRIRREHRALHFDAGLQFHDSDNRHLITYTKTSPDERSRLLMVVNLDPTHMQHGFIEVPIDVFGAAGTYTVRDLLTGARFTWEADRHYVRLDPALPAHILELQSPEARA